MSVNLNYSILQKSQALYPMHVAIQNGKYLYQTYTQLEHLKYHQLWHQQVAATPWSNGILKGNSIISKHKICGAPLNLLELDVSNELKHVRRQNYGLSTGCYDGRFTILKRTKQI